MSNKALTILAAVATVTTILAIILSGSANNTTTESIAPAYLIQGLDTAEIAQIIIKSGDNTTTLKRAGKNFYVVERENYPAEPKKVNDLLTKCLDIRISELYTDNPKNHDSLDVSDANSHTTVKFLKSDSSLLAGFASGKNTQIGGGTYVRLLPGNNVYTAQKFPYINSSPDDYIRQQLLSLNKKDIQSVTIVSPSQQYTLKRKDPNSSTIVLEKLPADKELKTSNAESVFTALTDLSFTDVLNASGSKAKNKKLKFDRKYICRLKNSTVYTIAVSRADDKTYITCSAEFTGKVPLKANKVESKEQLKKKEATLLTRDNAEEFTQKHSLWIYEIADFKAKYLTRPLDELLKDKKVQKETEAQKKTNEKPAPKIDRKPGKKTEKKTEKK